MYAFLGLVERENAVAGNMNPTYAVYMIGTRFSLQPIVESENRALALVTSFSDADAKEMVEMASKKRRVPKGLLMWFLCDRYGIPEGPALLVKNLPETSRIAGPLPHDSRGSGLDPYTDWFGVVTKPVIAQHARLEKQKKGEKNG